ncbi:MAG: WG repeat-containing protein [Bacteroidetes bacterium]|nr:WG repeat-containing protein [Bacteroidota bacterium]
MKLITKNFVSILLILPLLVPAQKKDDYLIKKCRKGMEDVCGYCTPGGEIVIRDGKYEMCYTDTFRNMAIVYHKDKGLVGIDRQENVLFNVFVVDNGPDYPSEGLFRIIKDNLIGFADLEGNIVIEPAYKAARPFHEGYAAFSPDCKVVSEDGHLCWKGGKWGFLDKKGNQDCPPIYDRIIEDFKDGKTLVEEGGNIFYMAKASPRDKHPPTYRLLKAEEPVQDKPEYIQPKQENMVTIQHYGLWTELMETGMKSCITGAGDLKAHIRFSWNTLNESIFSGATGANFLKAELLIEDKRIAGYEIYPWQDLYYNKPNNELITYMELIGVNPFAMIYKTFIFSGLSQHEQKIINRIEEYFSGLSSIRKTAGFVEPAGMQIISKGLNPYYIVLQVAEPGTGMPDPDLLCKIAGDRMLNLFVAPDIGQVRQSWIKPCLKTNHSILEKEILNFYNRRLSERTKKVTFSTDELEEIKDTCMKHLITEEWFDESKFDLYISLINKVLSEPQAIIPQYPLHGMFPDYEPRLSPDMMLDYNPSLYSKVEELPEALPENIPALLDMFEKYQKEAKKNPGVWVEGNMILGADPQQYEPSDAELLVGEIGERIQSIAESPDKQKIIEVLDKNNIKTREILYRRFWFRHCDVMGSGRFFYVDRFEKVNVELK